MTDRARIPSRPHLILPALDPRTSERWVKLSERTQAAASGSRPSVVNEVLKAEASRKPEAPVAPAYRLWIAENLAREGRYQEKWSRGDSNP
jgi:hypothetical protein